MGVKKKPELLAPAGNLDALKAAVNAGADAVYFGCSAFNARAFAGNFEGESLDAAFNYCRTFGVKTNITLNTLVSDSEIPKVMRLVDELEAKYKPDAYIIQDLGLIKTLKIAYPSAVVHASTQMQLHSSLAASALKDMGVSRIVFARELSRENIISASSCGLETEIFVHGAICVCVSGGCLMSSAIGGRSGNRGECAQPCRQMYNGGYPLSLKDLSLAEYIPEICKIGIDCLKIEGSMKSPEYVYEVTQIYRKLIDECRKPTADEKKRLESAFSRSGFTDGYYTGKKGPIMFGVRSELDKERSRTMAVSITPKKLNAEIECSIKKGIPSVVTTRCGEICVSVEGAVPEFAHNRPLDATDVKTRLEKSGATVFSVDAKVNLDDGLIMPVSAINALRRDALEALQARIIESNMPSRNVKAFDLQAVSEHIQKEAEIVARFEGKLPSRDILETSLQYCDRVEFPLWCGIPDNIDLSKISLVLPRIIYDSETEEIKRMLKRAASEGITQVTVSNISHLSICEGFAVHGDYTLNVTNSRTVEVLKAFGFSDVCVSMEQRVSSVKKVLPLSYVVYGRMPLMHTDNCIIKNCGKCSNTSFCKSVIQDKTEACFPIMREFSHRNTIYNSVPTYLLDKKDLFDGVDRILMFTTETDREIKDIFRALHEGDPPEGEFTRSAYKRKGGVFVG